MTGHVTIVFNAGGSGSGKTSSSKALVNHWSDKANYLTTDDYCKPATIFRYLEVLEQKQKRQFNKENQVYSFVKYLQIMKQINNPEVQKMKKYFEELVEKELPEKNENHLAFESNEYSYLRYLSLIDELMKLETSLVNDYLKTQIVGTDLQNYIHNANFDKAESIDFSLLQTDITALLNNSSVNRIKYDCFTESRQVSEEVISPKAFLIVEGILALEFYLQRIRLHQLPLGTKIVCLFVETDDYRETINNRVKRDIVERGQANKKIVLDRENTTVGPAFFTNIANSKTAAKAFTIKNNGDLDSLQNKVKIIGEAIDEILTRDELIIENQRLSQNSSANITKLIYSLDFEKIENISPTIGGY